MARRKKKSGATSYGVLVPTIIGLLIIAWLYPFVRNVYESNPEATIGLTVMVIFVVGFPFLAIVLSAKVVGYLITRHSREVDVRLSPQEGDSSQHVPQREEKRGPQPAGARRPLEVLRRQETALDHMRCMDGREFERFLAEFFRKLGYEVKGTPVSADQGADLLLYKDERRIAVQAKQWAGTVGNKAVHEAHVGRTFYNTYEAWVVTTSAFTKAAVDAARNLGVRLIGGKELSEWVSKAMREEIQ